MKCNCENTHCSHGDASCTREAIPECRIEFLGEVCRECWNQYPEQHRIDTSPDKQIGYFFWYGDTEHGHWTVECKDCFSGDPSSDEISCIYHGNIFPYSQRCHVCRKTLVQPKTSAWCEMYPVK